MGTFAGISKSTGGGAADGKRRYGLEEPEDWDGRHKRARMEENDERRCILTTRCTEPAGWLKLEVPLSLI